MVQAMPLPGDASFGPGVPGHFDFTLLFEQSVFGILPAAAILTATPIFVRQTVANPRRAAAGWLLRLELTLVTAWFAAELANVVLWSSPAIRSPAALVSAVLLCAASLALGCMLYVGYIFRYRPPALVSLYLAITTLLDAAKIRSYFLRDLDSLAIVAIVAASLKLALILLEELSKASPLGPKYHGQKHAPQEIGAGFLNRSIFWWINSTLTLGFKNILRVHDLPELGPEFSSELLFARFQPQWAHVDKNARWPLIRACLATLLWEFVAAIPPRLIFLAFTFSQPFLIKRVTSLTGDGRPPDDVYVGTIVATALIFVGIAISKGYYRHLSYRMSTFIRGILVTSIFNKSLHLDRHVLARKEALTLMSTDIANIEGTVAQFHDLWASFLEIGLGIYLLSGFVGPICCLVLIPGVFITFMTTRITRPMGAAREAWNLKIEHRVAATSNALAQIKDIKTTGLASVVASYLQELRVAEIECSLKERKLRVTMHTLDVFADSITPTLVLVGSVFWATFPTSRSASDVFTTLSLVSLVSYPLVTVMLEIPRLATAVACFRRIEQYLKRDSLVGKRQRGSLAASCTTSNPSSLLTEKSHGRSGQSFNHVESDESEKSDFEETTPPRIAELRNATLIRSFDLRPILQNVSLQFVPGGITMVHGPVGSGKSSFVKTLLGEQSLDEGIVILPPGRVGYCDETPWLQNGDIRDNVLGQNEYFKYWYKKVLWACHLSEKNGEFSEGDRTKVGSNGSNLSGGQKQRVELARAAYGKPNLMILDDPCRGLDEQTAASVLERLFGYDGIIRQLGTTVIMTTSTSSHLAAADIAYLLDGNGSVQTIQQPTRGVLRILGLESSQSPPRGERESNSPEMQGGDEVSSANVASAKEFKHGDLSLYSFFARMAGWKLTLLSFGLLSLTAVAERMPPVYIRIWLDRDPANKKYFIGYALLTLAPSLLTIISMGLFYVKVSAETSINLHQRLLQTVIGATIWYLASIDNGSLLNRFSQDMSLLTQDMPKSFLEVSYLATLVLADVAIISSATAYAAVIAPLFLGVVFALQKYYLRTSRQIRYLGLEATAPLFTHFTETCDGIVHIRAMKWTGGFQRDCLGFLDYSQRPHYALFCIQRWLNLVLDLCIAAMATLCVSLALHFADSGSQTGIGLALVNLVSFGAIVSRLLEGWVNLETSLSALHRLKKFNEKAQMEEMPQDGLTDWKPSRGAVQLRSVTASYGGYSMGRDVLRSVTVDIPAGTKVAIVGATGSGKSSLLLTMLNLLEYSGAILIDGVNIRTVPPDVLRSRIITLSQDGVQLTGSVRRNLDPWASPEAEHSLSDSELHSVLEQVGLGGVVASRGGLGADMAAAGLSKGEKQLLFLARAMLRREYTDARVVLVDEGTSHVDTETDRRVQKIMGVAFRECTVVTVTHRLTGLTGMDKVLEMEAGRIINMIDRPRVDR